MSLFSFEADILSVCLKKKKRLIKFSEILKEKHFRNKTLRWTYKVLVGYYSKYKKLPTVDIFKNELMKTSFSEENKKQMLLTIKKLFKRKPKSSISYLEEEIGGKIEKEEFLIAVEKSIDALDKGENIGKAKKELLRRVLLGQTREGDMVRVLRDWKARQLLRKEMSKIPAKERFISTPYPSINALTKGIQKSEAATVAGLTGMGKSLIAGEFGVNSMMEGLNVLHFTLENTAEQTAQRYDSRISEIEYDTIKLYSFKGGQLEHFKETFRLLKNSMDNDVVIKEVGKDETSMIEVDKTINVLKADSFNVDFLIIDSCDIMSAVRNYESYRLDRASIYWDFKFYCKMKKLPGLTTTQLKSTAKWKIATVEDLAEAYDKARILDIVFVMSQEEEDYKNNIVRFSLDKNRDGPSGATVKLWKDSSRMRFMEVI